MYSNEPENRGQHITDLRDAIEHRATWFYYMFMEAKKRGLDSEFAHEAIKKCGCFHGDNKYTQTSDLKAFEKEFVSDNVRNIFQMDTECTDTRLDITFHYCPLVAAWRKLTDDQELIDEMCEIAMDGDRGICSQFKDFNFHLGKTIAKGDSICEVAFYKNQE